MERSLETLLYDSETDINMVPRSFTTSSIVSEPDSKKDVTQCDVGTLVEKAQGLALNISDIQTVAVSDGKDAATVAVNAQSMLNGNESGSTL